MRTAAHLWPFVYPVGGILLCGMGRAVGALRPERLACGHHEDMVYPR